MGIHKLLKHHQFISHPFETWIAEREKDFEQWFIPPPFLDILIGDTSLRKQDFHLSSNLIFGRPGSGKTAIRLKLERELIRKAPRSLILRYVNFMNVLSDTESPTLIKHTEELIRLGTIALIGYWYTFPDRYKELSPSQKAELAGLIYHYYETLPPDIKDKYTCDLSPILSKITSTIKMGKQTVLDLYNSVISVLKKEKITPTDWSSESSSSKSKISPMLRLGRFWKLASAIGVSSIWILIDSIDEVTGLSTGKDIFNVVAEMLLSTQILEFSQNEKQVICFKIFLTRPDEIVPLLEEANFRKDRIRMEEIIWTRQDLDIALRKRLSYFSNQNVNHFDSICESNAQGTHDLLLDSAKLRPRTLFRMAHEIFTEFHKNSSDEEFLLDKNSVKTGIENGLKAVIG